MSPFAYALLDIAKEEGNTASLEAIRNLCLTKIAAGEVKSIVNTSLNGKSFGFNVSKAADALFAEVSWAIRHYNRGTITAMQWDFSGLR